MGDIRENWTHEKVITHRFGFLLIVTQSCLQLLFVLHVLAIGQCYFEAKIEKMKKSGLLNKPSPPSHFQICALLWTQKIWQASQQLI